MPEYRVSTPVEQLLTAAGERGDESFETGRYLITYKDKASESGFESLKAQGLRVADARDAKDQAFGLESTGDADAVAFPEIGVALLSGEAFMERAMSMGLESTTDSPILSIEPEYFVFADGGSSDYLRGFLRAAETIARDLAETPESESVDEDDTGSSVQVLGATWGLTKCRVPLSARSGLGISVAVLDTGMDLGHPDFAGRSPVTQTFVGEPVQDLHSHGTHCIGTSCGPKAPVGSTQRYGIAHQARIFAGKVLTNSGSSAGGSVLAGMNWAIANRCTVISMSLGGQSPVQTAYTSAGSAALNRGLLIVAAAGNSAMNTGAPANSPTIMSVASAMWILRPSAFSNCRQKIEIAGAGSGSLRWSRGRGATDSRAAPAWQLLTWPVAPPCGRRPARLSAA